MSHNLVQLPSISDLTILLNSQHPFIPPPMTQIWVPSTESFPHAIHSPSTISRLYPLQLVLLEGAVQNAPRTIANGFRFAQSPGSQRQRRKRPRLENKDIKDASHPHEVAALIVNDPSVNFPIATPDLPHNGIPPEELFLLKSSIYPSIVTKKYTALALDPLKSHLMVYEYAVGAHWVIWDHDTGYVHLTGLWRAALQERSLQKNADGVLHVKANSKADIVKLLELTPKSLHQFIKRVRGGFLKIQGTWVPFHLCRKLALRFCYYIRYKLVPIFGTDFPNQCLHPSSAGFGELRYDESPSNLLLPQLSPRLLDKQAPQLRNNVNQVNQMKPLHYGHHLPFSQHMNQRYEGNINQNFPETNYNQGPFHEHVLRQGLSNFHFKSEKVQSPNDMSIPVPNHASTQVKEPIHDQKSHSMQIPVQHRSLPQLSTAPPMLVAPVLDRPAIEATRLLAPHTEVKHESIVDLSSMTYTDMIDLVNASKCLQSISQRESLSLELLTLLDKMRIDHLLS